MSLKRGSGRPDAVEEGERRAPPGGGGCGREGPPAVPDIRTSGCSGLKALFPVEGGAACRGSERDE